MGLPPSTSTHHERTSGTAEAHGQGNIILAVTVLTAVVVLLLDVEGAPKVELVMVVVARLNPEAVAGAKYNAATEVQLKTIVESSVVRARVETAPVDIAN